jgi:signal transduction histidine kinase
MKTRVMVVEDERIVALNLKQRLAKLGYDISTIATSGKQALEGIESNRPDIVLMDINIEGQIDGIETASRIPEDNHIPVVYLTAYSEEATLERARATKPYGFLLKPFSERELHATIEMALERCRADGLIRESHQRLEALLTENEQQRIGLKRSNDDLEEFAYVASHDLKAPLRAIAHLVGWIREDIGETASAEIVGNLELLKGRTERLQRMLDGLLAYSRLRLIDSQMEDVNLAELVHGIVILLSPPLDFVVQYTGELPLLRTHRISIQLVLQNLISNGLKHHDRADGRITISARTTNGVTEFRVIDDGPGIAPQFHERIFVIFQTLQSRDDVESSGIGLAMVKKQVETHGGRIWVESEPPVRGTTFIFTWGV